MELDDLFFFLFFFFFAFCSDNQGRSFFFSFLHFSQTIRAESVRPLRRITRDFDRSPFSMLINIIPARIPLLSATWRQGVGRGVLV